MLLIIEDIKLDPFLMVGEDLGDPEKENPGISQAPG